MLSIVKKKEPVIKVIIDPIPDPIPKPKPKRSKPKPAFKVKKTKATQVIDRILKKHQTNRADVFCLSRKPNLVNIRREIWVELHAMGFSLPMIGRICRPSMPYDHTTVLCGLRRYKKPSEEK